MIKILAFTRGIINETLEEAKRIYVANYLSFLCFHGLRRYRTVTDTMVVSTACHHYAVLRAKSPRSLPKLYSLKSALVATDTHISFKYDDYRSDESDGGQDLSDAEQCTISSAGGRPEIYSVPATSRSRTFSAVVVRQPGDGDCIYHAICYHVQDGWDAKHLRPAVASLMERNSHLMLGDLTLREWLECETGSSLADYTTRMAVTGWAGSPEIMLSSLLLNVNIHVYTASGGNFELISDFPCEGAMRAVHLLYDWSTHYDALDNVRIVSHSRSGVITDVVA